jgi:hypothetical protein
MTNAQRRAARKIVRENFDADITDFRNAANSKPPRGHAREQRRYFIDQFQQEQFYRKRSEEREARAGWVRPFKQTLKQLRTH